MGYVLLNNQGKESKISKKTAQEFFGCTGDVKKILCLPFAGIGQASGHTVKTIYEIREYKRKKKVEGVCVIRMGGIGDLIMLSSGLRELGWRGEKVTLATLPQHMSLMKAMKVCDVIPINDIGRYTFDRVIDLRFAVEPKEMGAICKGDWTDYTTKDRSDIFDELLDVHPAPKRFTLPVAKKQGDTVVINAAMVSAARSIIPKYVPVICKKIIKETGRPVVLIGQSQPWSNGLGVLGMPGLQNLIDKTDLKEMIDIISGAAIVVTPDTGTLHIAAALGKKTVALFGNIDPMTRVSYYPTVRALYPQGELPCVNFPCWDLHTCMTGKPQEGSKCMQLFTPQRVVEAVKESLGC